jgi:hypothetical protein
MLNSPAVSVLFVDLSVEVPGSLPSVPAAGVAQPSRYDLSDSC